MIERRAGQCSTERSACKSKGVGVRTERSRPYRLLGVEWAMAAKDFKSHAKNVTLILLMGSENQRSKLFDGQ